MKKIKKENLKEKVKKRMNQPLIKRILINVIVFCTVTFSIYYIIPRLIVDKPKIIEVYPQQVMMNSIFNNNRSIELKGHNMEDIVAVYINDVWEKNCSILSQDDEIVELKLPNEFLNNAGDYSIQLQVKSNSDIFSKSNKIKFSVLSNENILKPVITHTNPETIEFNGVFQRLEIYGENFTCNSEVYINGENKESELYNNCLLVDIPYTDWYSSEVLEICIQQFYNDYPTSIKSENYSIKTKAIVENTNSSEDSYNTNLKFVEKYLECLNNDTYIVIMAVKDESSGAITNELVNTMNELGLSVNLYEAGMRKSYISVLDGKNVIYEEVSEDALSYNDNIDGISIHVESAAYSVGNSSSIIINGIEYSVNERGLNIVVYDKIREKVVDSVSFDTFDGLEIRK